MNYEINGQVAEQVMRWKRHDWREHDAIPKTVYCSVCGDTRPKAATDPGLGEITDDFGLPLSPTLVRDYCLPPARAMPNYSGSLDAAFEMEEEIERRGLHQEYIQELLQWSSSTPTRDIASWQHPHLRGPGARTLWRVAHATPEQRCRAALEAVREK